MRSLIAIICVGSLAGAALCQTQATGVAEQLKIESFHVMRRTDSYGIAGFVLSNGTEKEVTSIELTCWLDDEREHATKVLVWAPKPIPAHHSRQFSDVNIGVVGLNSRSECRVTGAD